MSRPGRLLFIFLDGVGLGDADAPGNPFSVAGHPYLNSLLGGRLDASLPPVGRTGLQYLSIDAGLGVAGLPQSATGQTTLLTGVNGAEVMGRHYGPWPGPTLKKILDRDNIFRRVSRAGERVLLANMYPPRYFHSLETGSLRVNAPVYAALGAGIELLDLDAYQSGMAVSADLTGEYLSSFLPGARITTPQQAGRDLRRLAAGARLTFFDYWLSDQVGHRGTFEDAVATVERLDGFIEGALETGAAGEVTVLITSDHGNLEDKTVRGHTYAPVPLIAHGPEAHRFAAVKGLEDVFGVVTGLLLGDAATS